VPHHTTTVHRIPEQPIDELFLKRWSRRAMSGEPLTQEGLLTLFEAARWAPSSRNDQSWRFIYAKKDTASWETLLHLLAEGNRRWCQRASVLVVMISRKTHADGSENQTHAFSAGAAFENLALQGALLDLVIHPMGGFDHERARTALAVPDGWGINAMIAIGKPGDINDLDEKLRARETPSGRNPLQGFLMEGVFRES
jgi:nitroreductase